MNVTVSRRGTGIVQRLRLVLLSIVALLLVATLAVSASLTRLKTLQRETADRQVPVLATSSELQTEFAEVYLLAEQVGRANGYGAMTRLERQSDRAFRRIEAAIGRLQELDVTGPALTTLSASIDAAETDLEETLRLARRVVAGRRVLEIDNQAVEASHRRFRTLVDPAYTDTAYAFRRTLARATEDDRLGEAERDALDRLLLTQSSLTALIRGGESAVDLAAALTRIDDDPVALAGGAERIRLELRELPLMLTRLDDQDLRERLAGPLGELRQLVLRDNGLLAHIEQLARDRAATARSRAELVDAFGEMSTLVNRSVAEVEAAAAATARAFGRATDLTLAVLAATAALVLGVVLLSGYVVLERQINRRIGVLADEVLRIASGDDGEPVAVTGDDEIGDIARALKVFRENARELRRSNEELEKFAYAAAHDMRSPLRAIESLATWTLEDAGDALPADCRDNLVTLLERARRLSTLQNDLLDYAQAGEIDGSFADTDIRALVDEIHALIDPDRRFRIVVSGDTAPLRTHLTPLRQILLNLFANAIKHHDRDGGRIEVEVRRTSSRLQIAVRDDGPGIEPRFHEKIFGLFATLQSKDVVEGSGLGLSMVRKLVERYEGRIRVESDPALARGTTFAFDLPTQESAEAYRRAA